MHSHDINNELGGTSFKSRNKKWPKDPLVEDFSRWTAESFGNCQLLRRKASANAFVGAQPPSNRSEEDNKQDTKQNVELLMDEEGYPILPTWDTIKHEGSSYKKSLVSKFMAEMYRK